MPIPFDCPACDAPLSVPDAAAGKKIRCPECKAAVAVPDVEDDEPKPVKRKKAAKPPADDVDDRPRKKSKARRDEDEEDDEPARPKLKGTGPSIPGPVWAAYGICAPRDRRRPGGRGARGAWRRRAERGGAAGGRQAGAGRPGEGRARPREAGRGQVSTPPAHAGPLVFSPAFSRINRSFSRFSAASGAMGWRFGPAGRPSRAIASLIAPFPVPSAIAVRTGCSRD